MESDKLQNDNPTINLQQPFIDQPISKQPNIHQKRIFFNDTINPKEYLITSTLIYISQYYPKTNSLLEKLVETLLQNNQNNIHLLYNCSKTLSDDVLRQIMYGPSTTYIPPSEITHIHRMDTSLIYISEDQQTISFKDIINAYGELNLQSIIQKNRINQILWYSRSKTLSNNLFVNNRYISKQLRAELQIQGQNWLDATPLAGLFIVLKHLWKQLLSKIQQKQSLLIVSQKIRLQLARYSFLHNKILSNPVKQLAQDVFTHYETYIQAMFKQTASQLQANINDYVKILIEYSYCLLFYYKYKKCQKLMTKCCQVLQMELQYTGKLGRRTKFQSFDCAQLIMTLKNKGKVTIQQNQLTEFQKIQQQQAQKLSFPDAKKLIVQQIKKNTTKQINNQKQNIKQSFYDEDNVLLQKPMFAQQSLQTTQQQKSFVMTQQKLLIALAMVNYTYTTFPHDQILFQYINTSLSTILDHVNMLTYPLQFSTLLLRSFNEFSRTKYMERAIQQLQTLKNQFQIKAHKNVDIIFSTPYLTRLQFTMKFANKYMDIQMILTAVNLLKKAAMYEQCVDGLIQRDYKQKALQLVNQIIQQKGKTPRLLCMFGDIHHNEIKYYEQAWILSQKKYGRAMRSLGWVYFNKDNFAKAAQCFSFATQVNYYNPNTWFTLGCCYLRMEQFEKALRPFGESVRIDQTQGEAWGNIATCYIQLKKMKEAYSTLQQAVKHAEGNWKLWSNLLSVSLSLKQFYKYFECIQRLVRLNHSQLLTKPTMSKIQQVMKFKLYEALQEKIKKRMAYNFKNRIDRLFQFLQQKIGQNPIMWSAKTAYLQVILQYRVELYKHYRSLHKQNKIDLNDVIDGYQSELQTHETTLAETAFTKQMIVDCKQKQLNMYMKIGWEQNKMECEKIYGVLKEYMLIYKTYSVNKQDFAQFNIFIKGLKDKIQKCLQVKVLLPVVENK